MSDKRTAADSIADGTSLKVTLGGQLEELQKWVYAVPVIVLIGIGIHGWLMHGTRSPFLDGGVIMKYGDYGNEVANGEWWRIFTSMWLHINAMHLVGNMVALVIIGRSVERMIGWRGFALMYLLSGVGGALATNFLMPYTLSIGASGAVFGVFGCVVGFTVRYPGQFPSQGLSTLMWAGLAYLGYSVAFGTGPGVNWIAHAGGFVTGALCGAALTAPIEPHALPGRRKRDAVLAAGGVVVIVGALVALSGLVPNVRVAVGELFARDARITERAAAAEDIEQKILPAVRDARAYLDTLDRLPAHQREALRDFDRYFAARERAWSELSVALTDADFDAIETARWRHAAADDIRERLLSDFPEQAPDEATPVAPIIDVAIEAALGD